MEVGWNVYNSVSWSSGLWRLGVEAALGLPPSDLGMRVAVNLVSLCAVDLIGRRVIL